MKVLPKISSIVLSVLLVFSITASPLVMALPQYSSLITISEDENNSYTNLPVIVPMDNASLSVLGYMSQSGLDTRYLVGTSPVPHMVTDTKTLFVAPSIGGNSSLVTKYQFGDTQQDSFPIIVGDGGYITVPDNPALEPGNNFELEIEGYINSDKIVNSIIVNKERALNISMKNNKLTAELIHTPYDYPYIVGSTLAAASYSGNVVIDIPIEAEIGDTVIIISSVTYDIIGPAGWTSFRVQNYSLCYRKLQGGEGSTVTVNVAGSYKPFITYAVRNAGDIYLSETISSGDNSNKPDPPLLTIPDRRYKECLWFALGNSTANRPFTTAPSGYSDLLEHYARSSGGVAYYNTIAIATRQREVISENPGPFTTSYSVQWTAATMCIAPIDESILLSSDTLSEGSYTIKVVSNGTNISLYINDIQVDTKSLSGLSTYNLDSDFTIGQGFSFINYLSYKVNGVEKFKLERPTSMIIGNTLPDSLGNYDGIITWGSNPAGISYHVSSLEPLGTEIGSGDSGEANQPNILSPYNSPGWWTESEGDSLPFYEIFKWSANQLQIPVQIMWFGFFLSLAALIGVLSWLYLHQSLTLTAISTGAVMVMSTMIGGGLVPMWTIAMYVIVVLALIMLDRTMI